MGRTRILVVEDESIVALDIQQRLQRMGYQVVGVAATAEAAIRQADQTRPDLVLMDIKLRGAMDGIEAADTIRSRFHLPVIFLTAFADETTLRRAAVTEAFGYILKPFEERELAINIEIALYKHEMELKLRTSEERYMLAAQAANGGLWDWDLQTDTIYFSPRWKSILGYAEEEVGDDPSDWLGRVHPDDVEQLQVALATHRRGLTEYLENEYRMLHRDGSYRWMTTRGMLVRNQEGVAYRMVGSQADIDARKKAEEQLLYDAFHDALTGLPNRALFLDRLSQVLERTNRNSERMFAVLYLDLDQFKVINDSLGHNAGDELLIAIARLLRRSLRMTDTVARLGGDEFVILLDDLHEPEEAVQVAVRIQEALKAPFPVQGQCAYTSASIGVVTSVNGYERTMDILRDADIAMYQAKAAGKACYVIFEPAMRKSAIARLELESDLRRALERQEFELYYQPILVMATGRVAGMEALLRWHHPEHGCITPDDFIPLAEETGLIVPIGQWVLREACRQVQCWRSRLPGSEALYVSINVSGRQLTHPEFIRQLGDILAETGVPAPSLRLEITESVLMDNAELAMRAVDRLRQMGVELYIDDFGTGYSSLSYIQRFAINTIKIDRSFVQVINDNTDSSELIKSIVRFALDLGLETIAEGVETEEQLDRLKGLLCAYGQGFVISKPLAPEAAELFLAQAFSDMGRAFPVQMALLQSSPDNR